MRLFDWLRSRSSILVFVAFLNHAPGIDLPAFAGEASPVAVIQRPSRQYTIEQFMKTTTIFGSSFSPDEKKLLVNSNESTIFNAYTVSLRDGSMTPLTRSTTDSTIGLSWFPRDERILLSRDSGGNELTHLYVREIDGTERDLTPGEKVKAMFAGWSTDDRSFFVITNERDPRQLDLYRYDAKTYERALLFQNDGGYFISGVSGDGRWVALGKVESNVDNNMFIWDAVAREMKLITAHEGMAQYFADTFDPASKYLYYRTNDGTEFIRVRRYELATGRHEEVEKADWDIEYTYFSFNGRYRVTGTNDDGRTVIRIQDEKKKKRLELPRLPEGAIDAVEISRSEKHLAFYVNGDRAPNDLYVYTLGDKAPRRLTRSLNPEIDAEDLVEGRVVRFKSFDGLEIPNLLYKPHQASAENRAPALVFVHGGPGGQTRPGYYALTQYLINHGYVVLGINNRGSFGYGKSFLAADDRKHGREPLWDCLEAKKYLASLPYVDPDRIGIIGGSYGGYMTLAALAFHPDAFEVGVDIFGVSNWLRTLENIPPWWESGRKAMVGELGDPVADREMLTAISPVFHADRIRKPLLVLQGANDPRVLQAESDDIVSAVKKNGVPVEYIVFPDEGHGFSKKANQIEGDRAVLEFLDKHLKGKPASSPRD